MAAATEGAMESSPGSASVCRVKITYAHTGSAPPVYLAGSFTSPPWEPQELQYAELRPNGGETGEDAQLEYEFYREFDVKEGHWQYKFRVGQGDLWVLDESTATVIDDDGNRINSLTVQKNSTSQILEQTTPPETTSIEHGSTPSEDPVCHGSHAVDEGVGAPGISDLPGTGEEEAAKLENLPVKLSEPDIIPPQAEVTILKERDKAVPQDVEDKTNLILPGHENKGGELVGTHQSVLSVSDNSEAPKTSEKPNSGGPIGLAEEQPPETMEQASVEQQTTRSPLTSLLKEQEGTGSLTEYEVFPIQPVEESIDKFTEVFSSSDMPTSIEGSSADKEPASIEIPNFAEETPIPSTADEKVPDKEQTTYEGEPIDNGSPREVAENRQVGAEPDQCAEPERTQPSEPTSLPLLVVENTDHMLSHGDDFRADGSHAQISAYEKRAADAEPDEVLVSSERESGPELVHTGAVAKRDGHFAAKLTKPPEGEEAPEPEEEIKADDLGAEKGLEAAGGPVVTEEALGIAEAVEAERTLEVVDAPVAEDAVAIMEAAQSKGASGVEEVVDREVDAEPEKALEMAGASEVEEASGPQGGVEPEKAAEKSEALELEKSAETEGTPVVQGAAEPEAASGTTETEASRVEETVVVTGATKSADAPLVQEVSESEAAISKMEFLEADGASEVEETVVVSEAAKSPEVPAVGGLIRPTAEEAPGVELASEAEEAVEVVEAIRLEEAAVPEAALVEVLEVKEAPKVEETAAAAEVGGFSEQGGPGTTEAPETREALKPEKAAAPEIAETAEVAKVPEADGTTETENNVNHVPKATTGLTETVVSPDVERETGVELIETVVGSDENAIMQQPGKERDLVVHEHSEQPNLKHAASGEELVKDASHSHEFEMLSVFDTSVPQAHDDVNLVEASIARDSTSGANQHLETLTSFVAASKVPGIANEDFSEAHGVTGAPISATPVEHKPVVEDELKGEVPVGPSLLGSNEHGGRVDIGSVEEFPYTRVLGDSVTEAVAPATLSPSTNNVSKDTKEGYPGVEVVMGNEPDDGCQPTEETPEIERPREEDLAEVPQVVDTSIRTTAAKEEGLVADLEVGDEPSEISVSKEDCTGTPDIVNKSLETETEGEAAVEVVDSTNGPLETEMLKEQDPIQTSNFNESLETEVAEEQDPGKGFGVAEESINDPHQELTNPKAVIGKEVESELCGEVNYEEFSKLTPTTSAALVGSAPAPTTRDSSALVPDTGTLAMNSTNSELDKQAETLGHLNPEKDPAPDSELGEGQESSSTPDIVNATAETANSAKVTDGDEYTSQAGSSLPMLVDSRHGHETDSPRIEDAPLFTHECTMPCEEQPVDPEHQLKASFIGSEPPSELEGPSAVDLEDPLLEASPSDRGHVLERLKTTESRLEEDETSVEGVPPSPVLSNINGSQSSDPVAGRSSPPLVERSPNLDAIPEEEALSSTSQEPILPEATSAVPESQTASIAAVGASTALAGVAATTVAGQLEGSSEEGISQNGYPDGHPSAEPSGADCSVQIVPPPSGTKTGQSINASFDATAKVDQDIPISQVSTLSEENVLKPPSAGVSTESPPPLLEPSEVDKDAEKVQTKLVAKLHTPTDYKAQPRSEPGPANCDATLAESTRESGPAILENASAAIPSVFASTRSTSGLDADAGFELHDTVSDVPGAVKESQVKAHLSADASALPDAVMVKTAVEGELENRVLLESPVHDVISHGDTGAKILSGGSTLSTTSPAESIKLISNGASFSASQAARESQVEARVPDEVNTSVKAFAGGKLKCEDPLEQGASAGITSKGISNVIGAQKDAKLITGAVSGAVIGTAVLAEGAVSAVKASAKDRASDISQNTNLRTNGEAAKTKPQLVVQGHAVAESAQEQGETAMEGVAATKATKKPEYDDAKTSAPDVIATGKMTEAENGATQVKPRDMDGVGEDTPEGSVRQRKVATDASDRPRTPHSLQSAKAPKHSNIFKTFWRTVFGGWIGGLFSKIFSKKRHRA